MINSEKYRDLLSGRFEAELRKVDKNDQAVFQQDSAPCHVSKIMKQFFKEQKI